MKRPSQSHRPTGPTQRMLRVGELVRHAVSAFLQRGEVEDEVLTGAVITIPEVRMTPDLKLANVYVMPLGGERAAEIVEALDRHHRFIRGRIGSELDLRFTPELRFFVDTSFEEFARVDALLKSERVRQDLDDDQEPDA